jgi:hypothetical protein
MTPEERELTKKWIEIWRRAAPELERIRREEIRAADTARAIEALSGAFIAARCDHPPRPTSGLVEQQRRFHRRRP